MPERHPDHDLIQGSGRKGPWWRSSWSPWRSPAQALEGGGGGGLRPDPGLALRHLRHLHQGPRHLGDQPARRLGFDIVHFVWWIGIGHAGTLISAILVLMRQNWRDSLNRITEAMTLFAVLCAGTYP